MTVNDWDGKPFAVNEGIQLDLAPDDWHAGRLPRGSLFLIVSRVRWDSLTAVDGVTYVGLGGYSTDKRGHADRFVEVRVRVDVLYRLVHRRKPDEGHYV